MAEAALEHVSPEEPRLPKILSLVGDITDQDIAIRSDYDFRDLDPDALQNPNFKDDSAGDMSKEQSNTTGIGVWDG